LEYGHSTKLWDLETGKLLLELPDSANETVAFSPNGKWLGTCGVTDCHFWEVGSWKCVRTLHRGPSGIQGPIAFTEDGRLAAIPWTSYAVRLLETGSWREIATLEAPDPQFLSALSFSPDGAQLACATETKQIQLWDLRSIRRQLAAMKLDWDAPPLPAPATNQFAGPISVTVLGDTNQPSAKQ